MMQHFFVDYEALQELTPELCGKEGNVYQRDLVHQEIDTSLGISGLVMISS